MKMMMAAAAAALMAMPAAASAQMTGTQFVTKAGASDQYEIQSSRLLLQSTRNPRLRSFASQMIQDHTQSTQQVKTAAMRAGMRPAPPALDAKGARNLSQLRHADGRARDALYVQQQRASHQDALALHSSYARSGRVAPLRMAATKIAPVVRHHIEELRRM